MTAWFDYPAYLEEMHRLIGSAYRYLDVLVHPIVTALREPLSSAFGVYRSSDLRKRAILPTTSSSSPMTRLEVRQYWERRFAGWQRKFAPSMARTGLMLADRTSALVIYEHAGLRGGELRHEFVTDVSKVEMLQEHFERLWNDDSFELLHEDYRSLLFPFAGESIVRITADVYDELLARLGTDTSLLYHLDPYKFEEVVAELLRRQGLSVQHTRRSKDEGVDIFARYKTPIGTILYLVQCKRWKVENPVGIEVVNALWGVVERKAATGGMIVTTSSFTRGALAAARTLENRMSLADYRDLRRWLSDAGRSA